MRRIFSESRVMRGPNMWSANHHKIIAAKFDPLFLLDVDENMQRTLSQYFLENYKVTCSHEDTHHCFFDFALQTAGILQGENLYHNLIYPTPGILYGIIEYNVEEAGKVALQLTSDIIYSIIRGEEPLSKAEAIERVKAIAKRYAHGPSTSLIISAARKRNIPINVGPAGYIILGYGNKQKRISAAISHYTSCIGVNIAGNKQSTKKFLESAYIPVPKGFVVTDENDLMEIVTKLDYPLVTKPLNGNQGRNITCDITNFENLLIGFRYANEISNSVIIEKEIKGNDYRLLVIGNRFIAGSLRHPASITGDGYLNINELVERENSDHRRGNGHENILTKIKLDADAELCLQKQGLTTTCIPRNGQVVFLKLTANLSTGGTAEDVTDLIHPSNKSLAEKVSRIIGLDICGIDIISQDISLPLHENGGAVIEVNAAPGLRMHQYPNKGIAREVGEPIVDLMYEEGENGRIPIIAITGTNGKTTTTRLMAHALSFAGRKVGFSSTDGIYIDGEKIQAGDCSGPQSAKTILQDMTIDTAVLECARGGIIRSGLGFDYCDIAIVTNVAEDHLGLKDIYSVEDLAFVKVVVPQSVKKDGWAILNAADELVYAMKNKLECNIALFCTDSENKNIKSHLEQGGTVVYADNNKDIYIHHSEGRIFIFNAAEVPITRKGKAGFMIENLLPVVLASYFSGMQPSHIAMALKSFIPTPEHAPGRINEFKINGVNVILDYAHNPHGLRALAGYLKNISGRKLGIITGTGDRREEDIIEFGRISASMYDDIIIRFDRDLRGRSKESIVELLSRGIYDVNPEQSYQVIPDTKSALHYAVSNADKGSYVVICADNATYTLGLTQEVAMEFQNFEK